MKYLNIKINLKNINGDDFLLSIYDKRKIVTDFDMWVYAIKEQGHMT